MFFVVDTSKAMQAAAVLLRLQHGHRMNYMLLLKLLYLADRESLGETGRTITQDRLVAMKRGPLPSGVYDLIRGQHVDVGLWAEHIETDHYDVQLVKDPGVGRLSKYEVQKLQEIWKRYEDMDEWAMVEIMHKLPEWIKNNPGESSKPIPIEDILDAVGRGEEKDAIIEGLKQQQTYDRIFGRR